MKRVIFILLAIIICNSSCANEMTHEVTVKYYNPVRSQTSSTPLITADGSKIDLRKLRTGNLRWVAISRDLKKYYKYGDTIVIKSNNPKVSGKWVVKDLMNKRHVLTIDLLTHDRKLLTTPVKATIKKLK